MKKNLGRKKSRSYAMKGGAGPYVYEDEIQLTLDNPFTHFAVNSNDGTYNFNIPEKKTGGLFSKKTPAVNFTSFCELYQYYKENSPISCVHQWFESKDGKSYKAPSFVDILGIILLLMGAEKNAGGTTINSDKDAFLKITLLSSMLTLNKGPICEDQMGELLMSLPLQQAVLKQIQIHFLPTFQIHEMTTLPITSLNKFQIDRLLGLFKKALFFYRYSTLPTAGYLTFERMSTTDKAFGAFGGQQTIDSEKFKEDKSKSYFMNNSKMYREDALQSALAGVGPGHMALGGRRRTRVNRSNKNRRSRTRRSRTRRTTRRY
jgi:hypothetical protein